MRVLYFLTNEALQKTKYRAILMLPSTFIIILCLMYLFLFNLKIVPYVSCISTTYLIFSFILILSSIRLFIVDTKIHKGVKK